jgi:hypothetical protein
MAEGEIRIGELRIQGQDALISFGCLQRPLQGLQRLRQAKMMPRLVGRRLRGGYQKVEGKFWLAVLQFQQAAAKQGGNIAGIFGQRFPIEFARRCQISGAMPFGCQLQRMIAHEANITWLAAEVLS